MRSNCVIVGASLAGANAAIALRAESPHSRIVLIGAEPDAPYERPPLSKAFLRGDSPAEKLYVRPPSFYADHNIETRFGVPATRVDVAAHQVELETGERVPFDALLIATGARNRRVAIPGIERRGVYSLRTRADAERIRAEIAPGRSAVVVGMGFIGSEVAATLRTRGVNVTAVEPAKTPLERVLGAEIGSVIARVHREHGVHLVQGDAVAAFEGDDRVRAVVTKSGQRLGCDFAVVGVGVEPVVDLVEGTGVRVENGIVVDQHCATNVSGIFAAGDVANHYHPVFERQMRVEHYQNAIKQGVAAARNMLGQPVSYDDVHWFWSDQYDTNIQYAGHHSSWDQLVVRGRIDSGSFLACFVNANRIDAAVAFNRGRELRALMPVIKARRVVDLRAIEDERVDLRTLARA